MPASNTTNLYPDKFLGCCAQTISNGSRPVEVKWLPSEGDQMLAAAGASNHIGNGSVLIVGTGIDATATPNATEQAKFDIATNMVFEVTTVWEWEPVSGDVGSVVPSFTTPPATPLNAVLARIKDIGKFIYEHRDMVISAYSYASFNGSRPQRQNYLAY
jgi:hypothetical protein